MTDLRSPSPPSPLRAAAALAALLLASFAPAPSGAVQAEYSNLLALGRAAYDRRDYPTAIRSLRLACFGMLDEPKALADCLARLVLAQDKANDLEGIQQTFQRLSEIDEKFSAYKQGDLPADLRAALEPRLQARIPAATLEASPAFRHLAAKKPDAVAAKGAAGKEKGSSRARPAETATKAPAAPAPAAKPGAEPPKAKSPAATPPKPLQETPAPGTGPAGLPTPPGGSGQAPAASPAAAPSASAPPPAPPTNPPAATVPAARPLADAERDTLQQAREKLASEQSARELRSIFEATKTVADAHPDSREAQHLVGQSAYRLSRWPEAVTYFKRGGDPGDEQSELLFYVAVSLFESGDVAGAAATLRRALPNLRRTEYVDKYAKKILGQ